MTAVLTADGWPGLRQGFRLTRERRVGGKVSRQVVHGITSLPPERADAAALLGWSRGHWGIENRLHYQRDVALAEDACRVRRGHAPQLLAALRNAVLFLSQQVNPCTTAALQHLAANVHRAVQLVTETKLKL